MDIPSLKTDSSKLVSNMIIYPQREFICEVRKSTRVGGLEGTGVAHDCKDERGDLRGWRSL